MYVEIGLVKNGGTYRLQNNAVNGVSRTFLFVCRHTLSCDILEMLVANEVNKKCVK